MRLNLSQIKIDGGTQPRTKICQQTVQEYTEAVMNHAVFPPVTVFFDGINYYLADGYHRYFAHKAAAVPGIEVEVHNGTQRDAILFSVGTNYAHGLRRSKEDKRKAVLTLLNDFEWNMWSDREISRACNVSAPFVGSVRESLGEEKKGEKKYKTKHGTEAVMDTSSIGKSGDEKAKKEPTAEDFLSDEIAVLADENERLNDRLAVAAYEATEEEKQLAEETIGSLRERVKQLEIEVETLKSSRDSFMAENAQLKKQLAGYKKKLNHLQAL